MPLKKKRDRDPPSPTEPRSRIRLDDDHPRDDESSTAVPPIVVYEADNGIGASEPSTPIRKGSHRSAIPSTFAESPSVLASSCSSVGHDRAERQSVAYGPAVQIPSEIPCDLYASFEERTSRIKTGLTVAPFEKKCYWTLEEIAESFCKQKYEEHLKIKDGEGYGDREILFRYGNCKILGEDGYEKRLPLRWSDDWDKIKSSIANCRSKVSHLEIYREYGACRNSAPKGKIKSAKRSDIHALMRSALDPTEGRTYVPHTDLEKVINDDVITDIVDEDPPGGMSPDQKADFISTVRSKATNLFAMWIYDGLPMECLRKLLDRSYDDTKLPLTKRDQCHNNSHCKIQFEKGCLQTQRSFIGARFNMLGEHQDFATHVVVPINFYPLDQDRSLLKEIQSPIQEEAQDSQNLEDTDKKKACCGTGGYSSVYRVKVDPNHHELSEDKDTYFALKEFKDRPQKGDAYFRKELAILNELRINSHPHIITHLATWTQAERYYMLFPYAECNLLEFMDRNSFDANDVGQTMWLLKQIHGLASALKHIDDLSGGDEVAHARSPTLAPESAEKPERKGSWHHDIKPANILFLRATDPPKATFKISDWGSGKVITYRSRSIPTPSPAGTITYEPPEILSEGKTSRPYDVWSLGCVFLELIIWALWGVNSVQLFREERIGPREPQKPIKDDAFWQQNMDGTFVLRHSVNAWLQELHAEMQKKDTIGFRSVQSIDLLVTEMLEVQPSVRISAPKVMDWTDRILRRYENDIKGGPSDPDLPRVSVEHPDDRSPAPLHMSSPTTGHPGPTYGELLQASPVEMPSPQWGRGQHSRNVSGNELTPSVASRSRNTSNASSTLSIRDGRHKESKVDARKTPDGDKQS